MSFFYSVFGFLIAIAVLVAVHEFGHFWVARKLGVKVLRYSVGFGKPLWKKVAGEDQICLLYTSPSPRDLSTSRMPSSA